MSHGHHGGGHHHGGHHHHEYNYGHHHHRYRRERLMMGEWPLFPGLFGAFGRPRYYYGPRHRRSGCSIFAVVFGILILLAFVHFWWLLIPLAILVVLGIASLLKSLGNKPGGAGANYPPPNQSYQPYQPYQANQPYQQGYAAPPPPPGSQPYQSSGWGQYGTPQAQYPQNMPPMP